jgi:hypothetical protein
MVMQSMIFVWRSPEAPAPIPGIRADVERDGLCWGRHDADPNERWWRVLEAASVAVGTSEFHNPTVQTPAARLLAFEQRTFRLAGRHVGIFVGPGVDAEQIGREVQGIYEMLKWAVVARFR